MNSDKIIMLLGGIVFLFFSIWLFFYMFKETKNGYRSGFGNDIKPQLVEVYNFDLKYTKLSAPAWRAYAQLGASMQHLPAGSPNWLKLIAST
jgi:succinate dehydrogenase hydrophobic anchor subunit